MEVSLIWTGTEPGWCCQVFIYNLVVLLLCLNLLVLGAIFSKPLVALSGAVPEPNEKEEEEEEDEEEEEENEPALPQEDGKAYLNLPIDIWHNFTFYNFIIFRFIYCSNQVALVSVFFI